MKFADGREYEIGDVVKFSTRHGSEGRGRVIGFSKIRGVTTVRITPLYERKSNMDSWNTIDRLNRDGLFGNEIVGNITRAR